MIIPTTSISSWLNRALELGDSHFLLLPFSFTGNHSSPLFPSIGRRPLKVIHSILSFRISECATAAAYTQSVSYRQERTQHGICLYRDNYFVNDHHLLGLIPANFLAIFTYFASYPSLSTATATASCSWYSCFPIFASLTLRTKNNQTSSTCVYRCKND